MSCKWQMASMSSRMAPPLFYLRAWETYRVIHTVSSPLASPWEESSSRRRGG